MTTIEFFVPGIPRPGGSKKGFFNPKLKRVMMVKAGGQNEENWRQAVVAAARVAMGDRPPFTGAIEASYDFIMPRPKYHKYTSKLRFGQLKEEYAGEPCPHIVMPDRGKLLRSTEDAMKGVVWEDDSQVWKGPLTKRYGAQPGALIRIEAMAAPTPPEPKTQPLLAGMEAE